MFYVEIYENTTKLRLVFYATFRLGIYAVKGIWLSYNMSVRVPVNEQLLDLSAQYDVYGLLQIESIGC